MNEKSRTLLIISSAIAFLWAMLNLCGICYIYFKYIRGLKIKQKFVHYFYASAGVLMCLIMMKALVTVPFVLTKEQHDTLHKQVWFLIPIKLINIIDVSIGYSVVAAMFKIAVSIQLVNMKITIQERQRKKCKFYTFCFVMTIIFFLQSVTISIYNYIENTELRYVSKTISFVWFASLSIVYWFTMRMLITELRVIDPVRELEDFSAERRKLTG